MRPGVPCGSGVGSRMSSATYSRTPRRTSAPAAQGVMTLTIIFAEKYRLTTADDPAVQTLGSPVRLASRSRISVSRRTSSGAASVIASLLRSMCAFAFV